jgi:uncharacterized protein (TIGR00251 family)
VARLYVRVSPGAKRSEVSGLDGGELRLRIAAPASEGKANRELLTFLARSLGVSQSAVSLVRGAGSRHKLVEIEGLTTEQAVQRLLP